MLEPPDVMHLADGALVGSGLTDSSEGLGYPIHVIRIGSG